MQPRAGRPTPWSPGSSAKFSTPSPKIDTLANTDALTGLVNRRRFEELLTAELAADRRRDDRSIALAYVDLDGLKESNDTEGHETGDLLLIAFGRAARRAFRDTDVLARLGGDEFCFLVRGVDAAAATSVMTRLFCELHDSDPPIRASAGVVVGRPPPNTSAAAALSIADALMLRAKRAGKSRFVLDEACWASTTSEDGLPTI